jgi:two-component system KDP operon response regulator KdpE
MEQPNKVLSPKILVRRVWGDEYESESDYVRRYIWYLRQKLETSPDEPEYIRNERNMGYYFAAGSAVS